MGGNGAGKSTLMKIIAGVETPDSGELTIGDRVCAPQPGAGPPAGHLSGAAGADAVSQPQRAREHSLSFAEAGGYRRATAVQQLNCQINLDASASTLEVADQQMVEILRGLMREARILILMNPPPL